MALAGDGCLQEGVASEAAALAGHLGLDNLILIYDSNDVTLDAMAKSPHKAKTPPSDSKRTALDVVSVDGHNLNAVNEAFTQAKSNDNGKPKLIIARTEIGRGIPEVFRHSEGARRRWREIRRISPSGTWASG